MNFLGWHSFAKPCRFQVYTSIKHHPHTASCSHSPSKVSFHPHFPASLPPPPLPLATTMPLCVCATYACFFLNNFSIMEFFAVFLLVSFLVAFHHGPWKSTSALPVCVKLFKKKPGILWCPRIFFWIHSSWQGHLCYDWHESPLY